MWNVQGWQKGNANENFRNDTAVQWWNNLANNRIYKNTRLTILRFMHTRRRSVSLHKITAKQDASLFILGSSFDPLFLSIGSSIFVPTTSGYKIRDNSCFQWSLRQVLFTLAERRFPLLNCLVLSHFTFWGFVNNKSS